MSVRRNRLAFAPRLEALEDRAVPSVSLSGTTLSILGTDKSDRIVITYNAGQAKSTVNFNGQIFTIAANQVINTANVSTGDGNDSVVLRSPVPLGGDVDFTGNVSLGDDDDSFLAQTSKNINAGARVTLNVNGDDGKDNITVDLKGAHVYEGAVATLNLNGGDDDDSIFFNYKGRVIGDIVANLNGGDGEDRLNVTARFRPPENGGSGTFRALISGGDDDDTIGAYITKQPGGDYRVSGHIDAGGGDGDIVWHTANISASGFENGGIVVLPD